MHQYNGILCHYENKNEDILDVLMERSPKYIIKGKKQGVYKIGHWKPDGGVISAIAKNKKPWEGLKVQWVKKCKASNLDLRTEKEDYLREKNFCAVTDLLQFH